MRILTIFKRGIRWTGLSTMVSAGSGILQLFILLFFLEKSDFALYALVAVFINIGLQLQEAGINPAIIQQQENDDLQLSSLFWLNQMIGLFLVILSLLISYPLVYFYQEEILAPLTCLYGLVFLINGVGIQYRILLQHQYQFKQLAIIEILSISTGMCITIFLAIQGWGPYSLVIGILMRYTVLSIGAIVVAFKAFQLRFVLRLDSIRKHINFGRNHLGERLVTHFVYQLDILLIGKWLGTEALGVYDVFKRLLLRPITLLIITIEKVSFPVFAKMQNDTAALKTLYLKLLNTSCALVFPIYLILIFWAPTIVKYFYGIEWLEHIIAFQLLGVYAAFSVVTQPIDTFLLAKDRIHYWMYAHLLLAPVMVFFLYLGTMKGLIGGLVFLLLVRIVFIFASYLFIIKKTMEATMTEYFKAILLPLSLVIGAALFSILPIAIFNVSSLIATISVSSIFVFLYTFFSEQFNKAFIQTMASLFLKKSFFDKSHD